MSAVRRTAAVESQDRVVEQYHGIEVVEEFRWLEDPHSSRTHQWIADQTTISRSYLDSLKERPALFPRIEAALDHDSIAQICIAGENIFYTRRRVGEEQAKLYRRSGLVRPDELVLDPALLGESSSLSLSLLGASPNGRHIAVGLRAGGEGTRRLTILDVKTKTKRVELPKAAIRGFGFLPNDDGFLYSLDVIGDLGHTKSSRSREVRIHYYDRTEAADFAIFKTASAENIRLVSEVQDSWSIAIHGVIRSISGHNEYSYYLQNLRDPSFPIQLLAENLSEQWDVRADRGELYVLLTSPKGSDQSIVRLPFSNPDLSLAQLIVSDTHGQIQSWQIFDQYLVIVSVRDLSCHVDLFSREGRPLGHIDLPEQGTVNILAGNPDGVFYSFESYTSIPKVFFYRFASGQSVSFSAPRTSSSGAVQNSFISRIVEYSADDSTLIPLTLLGMRDILERGNAPILLTAYGASGVSLTPRHSCLATSFVRLGGIFAIAHVRGGGEKGREWASAGRRRNRPTVHRDFIAAAKYIAESGLGNRARIAIAGGSNSGLLVATAMTQHPELFRAVICLAPFTDMLRYHIFDNTQFYVPNFGCSEDREDFPILLGYSPYHNVSDGVTYPSLLMISGAADTRCDPMHARKFVARVQQATRALPQQVRDEHPILLDWDWRRGHAATLPLDTRISSLVDRLAFLCHQLEMEVQ